MSTQGLSLAPALLNLEPKECRNASYCQTLDSGHWGFSVNTTISTSHSCSLEQGQPVVTRRPFGNVGFVINCQAFGQLFSATFWPGVYTDVSGKSLESFKGLLALLVHTVTCI